MTHTVGYLVGSHVLYNHRALPLLLTSMITLNDIAPGRIVVAVNGSGQEHYLCESGIHYYFRCGEFLSHFAPLVNLQLGLTLGIEYWFYLNCTSKCGPAFKSLVEGGFDPQADATLAGGLLSLGEGGGTDGRAINDLAMYRYSYLVRDTDKINAMDMTNLRNEGLLYAHAPKQSHYPRIGNEVTGPTDVYGTGTPRITEYYPGIDWYRFKKNWGQLPMGSYKVAML